MSEKRYSVKKYLYATIIFHRNFDAEIIKILYISIYIYIFYIYLYICVCMYIYIYIYIYIYKTVKIIKYVVL